MLLLLPLLCNHAVYKNIYVVRYYCSENRCLTDVGGQIERKHIFNTYIRGPWKSEFST